MGTLWREKYTTTKCCRVSSKRNVWLAAAVSPREFRLGMSRMIIFGLYIRDIPSSDTREVMFWAHYHCHPTRGGFRTVTTTQNGGPVCAKHVFLLIVTIIRHVESCINNLLKVQTVRKVWRYEGCTIQSWLVLQLRFFICLLWWFTNLTMWWFTQLMETTTLEQNKN